MSARPQSKRSATVTVEEKDRKAEKEFFSLLAKARELQGSVLHLRPLRPPFIRLFGRMESLGEVPLSPSEVERLIFSVLNSSQKERLIRQWQLEFGLTVEGLGRHRCNISRQQLGWEAAYRLIPEVVPTIASLGLPPVHRALCENRQGLVIVTGNAGSGKTTTIAAMLQHINETRRHHIITIEDPVEYVFDSNLAHITQREIGAHTESFPMALRGALRQDPDVMMIGDLRDLETTSIAISAAETGHLVLATLHTNSAMRTVARIMDVFPPSQRAQICIMVAESLRGIITQQLIPLRDHPGLALAQEILVVTPAAAQLIKEGKTHLLVSTMQSGKRLGMQTMDDALMELVQKKVISAEEAYTRSDNKVLFESLRKTN
jgi:twitching motility protein PilT